MSYERSDDVPMADYEAYCDADMSGAADWIVQGPTPEQVTALATVIWRREQNGKLPAERLHPVIRTQLEAKARHILRMVAEAAVSRENPPQEPAP